MSDNSWTKIDFINNARFWRHWGNDAALPFRVRNLADTIRVLSALGIECSLHGSTLAHALSLGELCDDHDDDLAISVDYPEFRTVAIPALVRAGFTIIRDSDLVSAERWGRYIDFHPAGIGAVTFRKIHGEQVPVSEHADTWMRENALRKSLRQQRKRNSSLPVRVRQAAEKVLQAAENPSMAFGYRLERIGRKLVTRAKSRVPETLTESEFLSIKLDAEDSGNWSWRGQHFTKLARPGMTLGDILDASANKKFFTGIVETPTGGTFDEPIALSRGFWHSGNNFFIAPLMFGFRHLVMPYSSANLYIRRIREPLLYTANYFNSLTVMEPKEIEHFLKTRPVEVTDMGLTSGRHRAMAMLGNMLGGGRYVPMTAEIR